MDCRTALKDYASFEFTDGPWTREVFRRGQGPAVIVIHEMPGLHPLVVRFADHVVAAGMTAFMPSLFGTPGRPVTIPYALGEMFKGICIAREFNVWSTQRSSPIVDWLRALARAAHASCGGKGVGAVGMCFTGGFALAMMTEPQCSHPFFRNLRCRWPRAPRSGPPGSTPHRRKSLAQNRASKRRICP